MEVIASIINTIIAISAGFLLASPLILLWWLLGKMQARTRSGWSHHPDRHAAHYDPDDYMGTSGYDFDSEQQYDRHDTFDYDVYTDTGEAGSGE